MPGPEYEALPEARASTRKSATIRGCGKAIASSQ